jgi:hypothetical protein
MGFAEALDQFWRRREKPKEQVGDFNPEAHSALYFQFLFTTKQKRKRKVGFFS